MKSVIFINRVYPPDHGATGQLLGELAEALAREGWRVTIVAAGNEADSKITPGSSVTVYRVGGLPFTRAVLWKRALSYASLYPALLWRLLRLPRHDVVVTLTDPPLQLLLGPAIKIFKGGSLLHWAQDLYPELAEELGVLRKGGPSAGMLRALSNWALRRHDTIVAVGRCMSERLEERGINPERIFVIPNWAVGFTDVSQIHPPEPKARPFTILYSGNFGLAHPFEGIVEAVKILDRDAASVRFVFAGNGPRRNFVHEHLVACRNAEFRESARLEELQASLAAADVHLACMSKELLGLVVPSKVYGALAAGRPCIFLGPRQSEVARFLVESGRGVVLGPADGKSLAVLLREWSLRGADFARLQSACESPARGNVSAVPLADFRDAFERSLRSVNECD